MSQEWILITGVSGFIGFKTLILALEAGHRVRAVIRKESQISKLAAHTRVVPHKANLEFAIIPDLSKQSVFDIHLKDVIAIVHLASPLAVESDEMERDIVQPAIDITMSILESANKAAHVRRVIITSSAVTLMPFEWLMNPDLTVFTEANINSTPIRPFQNSMQAYWASKGIARALSRKFVSEKSPKFDIINLLPTVVLGADELATDTMSILQGVRGMVMNGLVLGQNLPMPLVGQQVHVDDVARAHVDAIDLRIQGNKDYVLTGDDTDGIVWDNGKKFAAKHFPSALSAGTLSQNGTLPTISFRIDSSSTEKEFGWKCQSYEQTLKSFVGQYVELLDSGRS